MQNEIICDPALPISLDERPLASAAGRLRLACLLFVALLATCAALQAVPTSASAATHVTGGMTIGTGQKCCGTGGLVVRDRLTLKPMLLTNHHVVGLNSETTIPEGRLVYNPSNGDLIGRVKRNKFDFNNGLDMAVVELDPSVSYDANVMGAGPTGNGKFAGVGEPVTGDTARLYDRFKGKWVTGTISAVYGDEIRITPTDAQEGFGRSGLSGSIVFDSQWKAVGLLYAQNCSTTACYDTSATRLMSVHYWMSTWWIPDVIEVSGPGGGM